MSKKLLLILLLFLSLNTFSQEFTSIWNTNNTSARSTSNTTITIPTNPAYTNYDYTVNWGDGEIDTNVTGDITHTYLGGPGNYTVSISGDFPAIYFNNENTGDKLKIVEILDWGTIQWESMENAFYGCVNLNFDAIGSPDLSQVTTLKNMFRNGFLFNGIINDWDISTITDISGMFQNCMVFNRPLDLWDTRSITDMSYTFNEARVFNEPLDNWKTGAVTTMARMFDNAQMFNQNINNWDVSQVTDMSRLFYYARVYNQPLNNWDVSKVTTMASMFFITPFNQPINNWTVGNVTDISGMFQNSQFNQPLDLWDVSNVTNMSGTFAANNTFNQPLNNWNVSKVTNMSNTFGRAGSLKAFNQPLDLWDVSNVTNMSGMFQSSSFNQPLNSWDVSKVTNMSNMFSGWASVFTTVFDQPLNLWDVSKVTNMSGMFKDSNFNQSVEIWDVSNVTNMSNMFFNARQFNQPLNNWTTTSLRVLDGMFERTPQFNQPLNNWNTSLVTSMRTMFSAASVFDQDLTAWNISAVTNMTSIFSNSNLSQENYDAILIGWATQTVQEDVEFGAISIKYCDGRLARQELIDTHNWNITGDIVNCTNVFCTTIINPAAGDTNVPANSNIRWEAAPNADGYYIDLEVERAGVRSFVNISGSPADDYDVGNVQILSFTNEFTPGDTIFITVTPYNDEGPAVGCEELSFTVVPSWVNSPDAYKITIDTRLGSTSGNDQFNFRMQRNRSFNYNYSIDWGDSEYNNNVTNTITHVYNTPGVYTIAVIGDFPAPYFNYNGDSDEVISIDQWGTHAYKSMEKACFECENMEYNATDVPNITLVENMSEMFYRAQKFNGNINNWNVSNVTNMRSAFYNNYAFNQPLNTWDVSKVTDMYSMFQSAITFNQPLNSWVTNEVTTMDYMFNSATVFNQPLDNWDVSKVTSMVNMFERTDAFNQNINDWDVSAVKNMSSMFNDAISFNMALNDWNVSSVTDMNAMFNDAAVFNRPLNNWNVSSVNNMSYMFNNAINFNQNLDSWNVTNVVNMSSMFNNALSFNEPLNSWDVNSVVNMSFMFQKAEAFNQPINSWNVSAVANMTSMFKEAIIFNQPLNSWVVSSVTLMPYMFEGASVFNQPLNNWNTSVVTNFEAMFKNALAFNGPLNSWDTGEVLTMQEMFNGATAFNQNMDSWNTSFVATMEAMFEDAIAYNQTMNSWNVASVSTMKNMFKGATTFNADIGAWNVRAVSTMEEMFNGATAFNQNLNNWRVSGVSNMNYMFNEASAYNQEMNLWNLGNVSMRSTFYNATSLNQDLGDWDVSAVTDMSDMLDNTALIRENYDNTLIAWSEQTLTSGITLGAEGLPYCDALEERQSMIDNFGWTFSLDVRDCPIPECTQLVSPLNLDTDVPVNTNLTWEPAIFARGYYLTVGTAPGGNDILDREIISDETSFEFASDFNTGDVVFVSIIPFNDEGDAIGPCTEESFTISSDPATIPECTSLTEPVLPAEDVLVSSDISWRPISNADGYKLTVGTSSGASDILNAEDVGSITTYEFATNLPEDSDIFVTITPYNEEGDVICTEEEFHTELIPVPPTCTNLTSPVNEDTDVPIDTNLSWAPVTNATGYLVIVGTTSDGIEVVNNVDVGTDTTYDIPDDLLEDRLYYVTIIPYNVEGDAIGCIEETFTTGNATSPPSCTTLTTPTNLATRVAPDTSLTWSELSSATGYKLSVGTSTGGTEIFTGDVNNITTYDLPTDLPENTTIYATVTPYNDNGDAIGPCTEISFTTNGRPMCTTLNSPSNNATNVAFDLSSITWDSSVNADGYKITITANSSTANNETNLDIRGTTTHNFANNFELGETVTVTIVPYDDTIGDATGPCSVESFTIIPPPVPECTRLQTPTADAIDIAMDTNITWLPVEYADGYLLTVVASNSTANNLTDFDVTSGTSYNFSENFEQGETVTVTITPYNQVEKDTGCTSESFTVKAAPACTTLITPNSSANVSVETNLEWTVVPDADGYKLTVLSSDSTINNITDFDVTTGNVYTFTDDFEQGETVTVTITPYNTSGDAIGCTPERFIIASAPDCTNLVTPENNETVTEISEITWNAVTGADGYKLTIVANNDSANNVTALEVTETSYVFPNNFNEGEVVTVTITPYNLIGDAVGCAPESFTIRPLPECTTLNLPMAGATEVSVATDISWNTSEDADGYRISVGTSLTTTDIVNNEDVASLTNYTFAEDLPSESLIYVSITPYNTSGDGVSCNTQSFETAIVVPDCAALVSPFNGETDVSLESNIQWDIVEKIEGYRLSIGTTPNGVDILDNQDMETSTNYTHPEEFPINTQIHITIVPYNSKGDAVACEEQSFTTLVPEDNTKYGFSPDGDGINEYWHIENIEYYPKNAVTIYNRWGDAVFRIENYDNNAEVFRGNANLKTKMGAGLLPTGTYFFDIQIKGETILKKTKGYLVIKR